MLKKKWIVIYIILDIICLGLGMGVPFFNIPLGLPVGWFLSRKIADQRKVFKSLVLSSVFTFILLALIWIPTMLVFYFDPAKDIANFGEPLILFEPAASFWGWLVLMVVISPFLQLVFAVFAAYVTPIFSKKPESTLAE